MSGKRVLVLVTSRLLNRDTKMIKIGDIHVQNKCVFQQVTGFVEIAEAK